MWQNRESHHAWTVAERCGCSVFHLTSSFRTCWYHLIPSSLHRHHWSRASILCPSILVTAQHSELYRKMGRMQVLYSFNLVEMEIGHFHIWLSRFCTSDGIMTWDIRRALSCWVDKTAKINYSTTTTPSHGLCWWLVLPAAQGLDFCLLPVHLMPQRCRLCCHSLKCSSSNSARRATSLAKSRSEKECRPNETPFMFHGWANGSFQQPVQAHGKRVWCQHTPLVNSRLNCEPSTLRLRCTDTAVQCSNHFSNTH